MHGNATHQNHAETADQRSLVFRAEHPPGENRQNGSRHRGHRINIFPEYLGHLVCEDIANRTAADSRHRSEEGAEKQSVHADVNAGKDTVHREGRKAQGVTPEKQRIQRLLRARQTAIRIEIQKNDVRRNHRNQHINRIHKHDRRLFADHDVARHTAAAGRDDRENVDTENVHVPLHADQRAGNRKRNGTEQIHKTDD